MSILLVLCCIPDASSANEVVYRIMDAANLEWSGVGWDLPVIMERSEKNWASLEYVNNWFILAYKDT